MFGPSDSAATGTPRTADPFRESSRSAVFPQFGSRVWGPRDSEPVGPRTPAMQTPGGETVNMDPQIRIEIDPEAEAEAAALALAEAEAAAELGDDSA